MHSIFLDQLQYIMTDRVNANNCPGRDVCSKVEGYPAHENGYVCRNVDL